MRKAFINTLMELAQKDERIFLVTGDLGFSFLEEFKERFPGRFINAGISEQNMIGVSAGLALSGKVVFVYSIIPFVTMRCFEQIRNDLCYQNLNVRLIGVGGGLAYGAAGSTHYALEDVAIMRALVNMTVVSPGDPQEAQKAVKATVDHNGPVYIRLGKGNEPAIHARPDFKIDKGIVLKEGKDVALIATGSMLSVAKEVTSILADKKISVYLISMPTIKPLDNKLILKAAGRCKAVFTLEEHKIIGGLGSAVSEVLAESDLKVVFKRFGLPDKYFDYIGCQSYLLEKEALSAAKVAADILKKIKAIIKPGR